MYSERGKPQASSVLAQKRHSNREQRVLSPVHVPKHIQQAIVSPNGKSGNIQARLHMYNSLRIDPQTPATGPTFARVNKTLASIDNAAIGNTGAQVNTVQTPPTIGLGSPNNFFNAFVNSPNATIPNVSSGVVQSSSSPSKKYSRNFTANPKQSATQNSFFHVGAAQRPGDHPDKS